MNRGVDRILVGLGGSATTDAGIGALEALGAQVVREGGGAPGVVSIDPRGLPTPPREGITVFADTRATFTQAPEVFAPQKGATAEQVATLTEAFERLATESPSASAARMSGSGAAGGVGWALASYLGAVIVEGSRYLGNMLGVGRLLDGADFVITGEGQLDNTSVSGKAVGHIHQLANAYGVPGAIVCGNSPTETFNQWPVIRLVDRAISVEDAHRNASQHLEKVGAELARNSLSR
jgi:glycerate kinase